ncbi:hypothetical protein FRC11_002597 [Ceratobasidium sp. 423]|nr:hypothetical protein FRC11_002597 [Ceratobasidium sp. 423]
MPSNNYYACSGCSRTFKHKNSLSRHRISAHTSQQNKKPVHKDDRCAWCTTQFTVAGLKRHLLLHARCSRLEKIADGKEPEPTLSSDSSSGSDSDTSDFWDQPEPPKPDRRPATPLTRADDMESVHYEGEERDSPTAPPAGEPENFPEPDVLLTKMTDTEGHDIFMEPFPCPHAGQPIRQVNKPRRARRKYPDVGALSDAEAFEIAQLLMEPGISVRFRNRFLRLKRFRNRLPWHNARALRKDIDKLPHGPDWEVQPFKLTGNGGEEVVELWKRNPLDVI